MGSFFLIVSVVFLGKETQVRSPRVKNYKKTNCVSSAARALPELGAAYLSQQGLLVF